MLVTSLSLSLSHRFFTANQKNQVFVSIIYLMFLFIFSFCFYFDSLKKHLNHFIPTNSEWLAAKTKWNRLKSKLIFLNWKTYIVRVSNIGDINIKKFLFFADFWRKKKIFVLIGVFVMSFTSVRFVTNYYYFSGKKKSENSFL